MHIRRICESEGDAAGTLWDHMCRETGDGRPLTERARRDVSRMLAASAWHRDAFCLVAVHPGGRLAGFVNGRISTGDGLLPGLLGEIEALYVVPGDRGQGAGRALARAATDWLVAQGARTVRYLSCAGAHDDHRFWRSLGFEADMVCLSLYREP
ncbi:MULTISPECIES: GNAT family N-acetyltransferase [Streptomyces]|uniref:N-acetyltransferase domain-containing protein n=1 Tax=Streptomyces luteosporeus TaxID=173856 RepID=A0ABN3U6X5_9ACTN